MRERFQEHRLSIALWIYKLAVRKYESGKLGAWFDEHGILREVPALDTALEIAESAGATDEQLLEIENP